MASSEHPQAPPLNNEAPAESTRVSLPPLPQTPTIEATKSLRLCGWLDAILVILVLLFAFLAASYPAINSDFFRHAAMGRLLAQRQYQFGVDPFVYTAGDSYFVNHSWLFDLLIYGLYQLPAGGAVVVVFKALLMAVLAALLLREGRRSGQGLWIPASCTALAILVASPRFYLQSTSLSFLFLGVTLWLLLADGKSEKRLWWLPLLFALWVNCDAWFFLGPLTVALYLGGELLQYRWGYVSFSRGPETSALASGPRANENYRELRTLGLVLAFGVAACLVNPHHVRALTLPPEFGLTAAGDLLENDPQFYPLFLSPLGKNYYKPFLGLSVAGLAYWPLLLLGLASFVSLFNRVPWPRLLVWVGFALMSLYNWRAIPFFAIVAGPVTALNWLDFAAQRLGSGPPLPVSPPVRWGDTGGASRNWAVGGRFLTLLFGLALLVATVPGWLQRSYPSFHRIGWSVKADPSLQAMADAIRSWREAGVLSDEPHWFNTYWEIANYLAWFAPGERVFFDENLADFREAAEDYLAIRRGLEQLVERDSTDLRTDWQQILRDRKVRFWIYDNFGARASDLVAQSVLFTHPQEWVLCHLKGRIAIFAWRDPQRSESDPSTGLALDLKRSAFGPAAEPAPPRAVEPARPRDWWHTVWDVWWSGEAPLSSDRDGLALYEYRCQVVEIPREVYKHSCAWQGVVAASAIAGSLPRAPLPNSLLPLVWSYTYKELFLPGTVQRTRQPRKSEESAVQGWADYVNNQFIESPSLYLSVRAARRALLVNPEDGATYFHLGKIYQRLRSLPQESQLSKLPQQVAPQLLDVLRRTQLIAAFQNCLRFQPDDDQAAQAHQALFWIYFKEFGYIDAAVHHLREALDKRTAAGPPPGVSLTQFNQALDQMSAELTRQEEELNRRLDRYEVNAAAKSGLKRVEAALQEGLSETALKVLEQEAEVNNVTPDDLPLVKVVTGVILDLGQLGQARELLPDREGRRVKPEDLVLYLRLAAARGNYAEADQLLDDLLRHGWEPVPGQMPLGDPTFAASYAIGHVLSAGALVATNTPCFPVPHPIMPSSMWVRRWTLDAVVNGLLAAGQQGEWNLIRGLLALEAGRCAEARSCFETVRKLTVPSTPLAPEIDRLGADQSQKEGAQQLLFRHTVLYNQSTRYLDWLKEKSSHDSNGNVSQKRRDLDAPAKRH